MAFLKKIRPSMWPPNRTTLSAALLSLALLMPGGAEALPQSASLSDPQLRGTATFRFLGLAMYDARLYTPGGAPFNWSQDFGLELTYRRNIKKKAIVESTLEEMSRQGNPLPIGPELNKCFKGVSNGDKYMAISQGPDQVAFWRNGQKACTIKYPGIKRAFMSVFLGNNTRSASFTRQLKGQ